MTDPYVYANGTLRNRFRIKDAATLAATEANVTQFRLAGIAAHGPQGRFDFERLKATHRHIFQDVYAWAGRPRTTPLGRPQADGVTQWFLAPERIDTDATALFRRLERDGHLRGRPVGRFADEAASCFIAINNIHPFREGNGRAQRAFIEALAIAAGHSLAFDVITRERMTVASIEGHAGKPDRMRRMFHEIADPARVTALRELIDFFERHDVPDWNDRYIATTEPGRAYTGRLGGNNGTHAFLVVGPQILVAPARDMPGGVGSGGTIAFTAGGWAPPARGG